MSELTSHDQHPSVQQHCPTDDSGDQPNVLSPQESDEHGATDQVASEIAELGAVQQDWTNFLNQQECCPRAESDGSSELGSHGEGGPAVVAATNTCFHDTELTDVGFATRTTELRFLRAQAKKLRDEIKNHRAKVVAALACEGALEEINKLELELQRKVIESEQSDIEYRKQRTQDGPKEIQEFDDHSAQLEGAQREKVKTAMEYFRQAEADLEAKEIQEFDDHSAQLEGAQREKVKTTMEYFRQAEADLEDLKRDNKRERFSMQENNSLSEVRSKKIRASAMGDATKIAKEMIETSQNVLKEFKSRTRFV